MSFACIALKFGADIHGAQRMNPNDSDDPLTLQIAPPAGQTFHLSSEISQKSNGWIGTHP